MSFLYKIYFSNIGNKTGIWKRQFPTPINSCDIQQIFDALITAGSYVQVGNDSSGVGIDGSYSGSFGFFLGKIELSGGNPWDGIYNGINDLPVAGFNIKTAFAFATVAVPSNTTAVISSINNGISNFNPVYSPGNLTYAFEPVPSTFLMLTGDLQINITRTIAPGNVGPTNVSNCYCSGEYEIQSWTTTITSPTEIKTFANTDVEPIEPVVIESDPEDENAIDFTQLDPLQPIILEWDLERAYIMIPAIITMTTYYLEFIIDVYLLRLIKSRGRKTVNIKLNGGTQFDGEVSAGTLEILFFDGTGVYKISSGKRNDTIYVEEDVTEDFKIPDPTIKTGYIGT